MWLQNDYWIDTINANKNIKDQICCILSHADSGNSSWH